MKTDVEDSLADLSLKVISGEAKPDSTIDESISGKLSTALDLFSGKQSESVDIASVFSMFCKQFQSAYKALNAKSGQMVDLYTLAVYIFYNMKDFAENANQKIKDSWKNQGQVVERIPVSLAYEIGEKLSKNIISAIKNSIEYTVDPETGNAVPNQKAPEQNS